MQGYKIISKGETKAPQSTEFVNVSNYIVAEKDGVRYLLLKCYNGRHQLVDGITITLNQFDARKRLIKSDELTLNDIESKKEDYFVVNDKITLLPKCDSVRVEIISAKYGNYGYTRKGDGVSVSYAPDNRAETTKVASLKNELGDKGTAVAQHRLKSTVIISILAVVMLVALSALLFIQLLTFKITSEVFVYKNVEYVFVNGENSSDGDVKVVGYSGNPSEIIIDSEIDGHRVVCIEEDSFRNNASIEKLIINGDVEIKNSAFQDCVALSSVKINDVSIVGKRAFYNSNIQSLSASRLKSVGEYAFANCKNLVSVSLSLPTGQVVTLGSNTFENCESLKDVEISALTEYDGKNTFRGCEELVNVKLANFNYSPNTESTLSNRLHDYFEVGAPIETLEIGKLGSLPSGFMKDFQTVTFTVSESDVTKIEEDTFRGCARLKKLNLPNTVVELGDYALADTLIETFDVSVLTKIGDYAFNNCANLKTVNLGKNTRLTSIGDGAFSGCKSIIEITFPKNITKISKELFKDCESLKNFKFETGTKVTEFGARAFAGCKALQTIEVPTAIKYFSTSLFEGCLSLNRIDFPVFLAGIGERAFADCKSLSTVEFEDTLISIIEKEAFVNSGLLSVTIPTNVKTIGRGAFAGCKSLSNYNSYFIGGNSEEQGDLRKVFVTDVVEDGQVVGETDFPEKLIGVTITGVKEIPDEAFLNCTSVKTFKLDNDIRSIGKNAFNGCTSLEKIEYPQAENYSYPSTLEMIDEGAFNGCESMLSVNIPSTVSIKKGAYANTGLTKLSVTFADAAGLDGFNLSYYFGEDYTAVPETLSTVIVNGDGNVPARAFENCAFVREIELVGKIYSIGEKSFAGCTLLGDIEFSEYLQTISADAFKNCRSLSFLSLPSSVSSISSSAFMNNYNLYEVENNTIAYTNEQLKDWISSTLNVYSNIEDKMPSIENNGYTISQYQGEWYLTGYPKLDAELELPDRFVKEGTGMVVVSYRLPDNLFREHIALTEIEIPTSVSSLGATVFKNCSGLVSVAFDVNCDVTEISAQTFYECEALEEIILPNSVTTIGDEAFYKNGALVSITLPDALLEIGKFAFAENVLLESVEFNGNLQTIGDGAFAYNVKLSDVVIDGDISYIGVGAFMGNASLETVTIVSNQITSVIVENAFIVDETSAIEEEVEVKTVLESVTLSGITYIGNAAFKGNDALKTLNLGQSIIEIGDYAFSNCPITAINFPSSLQTVGIRAFENNTALRAININGNITNIGESAFAGNSALETVVISSTVTDSETVIGASAFADNEAIRSVSISGITHIGNDTFANIKTLRTLSLGNGLLNIGNNAFKGCLIATVAFPSSLQSIGDNAFESNTALTAVNINGNIVNIGESAFKDNTALTTVSVTSNFNGSVIIGETAFYGDSLITTVSLNGVTEIGDSAFSGLPKLETLDLGQSLTRIGGSAFYNASSLREITLPNSLIRIYDYAFDGCRRLYEVINLSDLPLSAGDRSYGYVTYYALAIYQSEYDTRRVVYQDNFVFAQPNNSSSWQLRRIHSVENPQSPLSLPTSFTAPNNTTIRRYEIANDAFSEVSNSYNSIMISSQVSKISNYALNNLYAKIYFYSDSSTWNSVYSGYYYNVYFRRAGAYCVHQSYQWTYNQNNQIVDTVSTGSNRIEPTCTTDGRIEGKCQVCNEILSTQILSKLGHSPSGLITEKYATCTEDGLRVNRCLRDNCGEVLDSEVLPKYGHALASWQQKIAATCTTKGMEVRICYNCREEVETREINALGHSIPSQWETVTPATCQSSGVRVKHCSRGCGVEVAREEIPKLSHVVGSDGKCQTCDDYWYVNSSNYEDLGFTNDATNAYTYSSGAKRFSSTNKTANSSSTLTFTASKAMTITFTLSVSSESGKDFFTLARNGETVYSISGTQTRNVELELQRGETLTFTYAKDESGSSNNDCGMITNVIIEYK